MLLHVTVAGAVLMATVLGANALVQSISGWNAETVVAAMTQVALGILEVPTRRTGPVLTGPMGDIQIVSECTGLHLFVILGAFILATPVSLPRRAAWLLAAVPLIFSLNLLRIVTAALLLIHVPEFFHATHDVGWPATALVFSLAYMSLWLRANRSLIGRRDS